MKLKLLFFALFHFAVLFLARVLPLDESMAPSALNPFYLAIKLILFFLAVLLPFWGYSGVMALLFRQPVAAWLREHDSSTLSLMWYAFLRLASGAVLCGLATFLATLTFGVSPLSISIVEAIGVTFALTSLTKLDNLSFREQIVRTRREFSAMSPLAKTLALIFFSGLLLKLVLVLRLTNHGDSYLYNLAVSDVWIRTGNPGLHLSNVFSGYALAVEHLYLYFRMLFTGSWEYAALAQTTHAILGYGLMVLSLLVIAQRYLSGRWFWFAGLLLLNSDFSAYGFMPKNDLFAISLFLAFWCSLIEGWTPFAVMACATVFIAKPNSAYCIGALSLWSLICLRSRSSAWQPVRLLFTLALGCTAMLITWSPFAINSWMKTGNPLFPLASEIFPSPLGKETSSLLFEYRPFSVTPLELVGSLWEAAKNLHVFAIAAGAAVLLPFLRPKSPAAKHRLMSLGLQFGAAFLVFFVIQIFSRKYMNGYAIRHFLFAMAPLVVLSVSLLSQTVELIGTRWGPLVQKRAQLGLLAALTLVALEKLHLEVCLREFGRFFSTKSQMDEFFQRKPSIHLNYLLTKHLSETARTDTPVLMAFNAGSLWLGSNVDIWTPQISYPAYFWKIEEMDLEAWRTEFIRHRIEFLKIDRTKNQAIWNLLSKLPHKKIAGTQEMFVVQLLL